MKTQTRIAAIVGALGVAAVVGAVAVTSAQNAEVPSAAAETSDRPDAITSFPGLDVAEGEPWLASLDTASPAPGSVAEAAGPFDDRFEFRALAFDGMTVTGEVLVTSDVSEIIELEVLSGFYDAEGRLVGDATFVLPRSAVHSHGGESTDEHAEEESGVPIELYAFEVAAPEGTAAVSAAVGVPVLVNE